LIKDVAHNHPQSPLGIDILSDTYSDNIYGDLFSDENVLKNLNYYTKNIQSNNFIAQKDIVKINLKLNNKKDAERGAEKYLKSMLNNDFVHYSPIPKSKKEIGKESYIADAYELLAEVSQANGNSVKAIAYLDSAIILYKSDSQNKFRAVSIQDNYKKKATIQKKLNQLDRALKTYETLYQETKDDRVLDSIKVLFKETQQEEGFESYAKNLKERVENKNQEPKKLAADFSIKDMSGYEIKLSEWKGRVVVLNFWANYCLPCAKEIPYLNKIWRETQTKDIIFLAVTKNTPIEVTRFAQRQKEMFGFSILPNAKELADIYNVNLVPTQIVINKKGEIVHRETGFGGNIDKLKQVVLEELKK